MTLKSNAEELALIGQEIGAEVIRGPVRYPGREGGLDLGGTDSGSGPVGYAKSGRHSGHCPRKLHRQGGNTR